jgi:hypothetical protein
MTTLKVSRRILDHIESQAFPDESVDETLRRLLGMTKGDPRPREKSPTSIIKVSREVLRYIIRASKDGELRNQTLCRLLGLPDDDGNIRRQELLREKSDGSALPSPTEAKDGSTEKRKRAPKG